jgi:hypothetical protein
MARITIRCHPLTPAPHDDLEVWLEERTAHLRDTHPRAIIRLSRLSQDLPTGELAIGWVLELDSGDISRSNGDTDLADALSDTVTDMRLLGLQPTALAPLDPDAGEVG